MVYYLRFWFHLLLVVVLIQVSALFYTFKTHSILSSNLNNLVAIVWIAEFSLTV